MSRRLARTLALALAATAAGCGVRAPAPIDQAALVRARGATEARRTLELRTIARPADVAARLALAALEEAQQRPSAALVQLEAVLAVGGPLGTRWRAEDRARFARLLAARGATRLARGAPSALADLTRARDFGAPVPDASLVAARRARAVIALRHVDAGVRAAARAALFPASATPAARGERGAWAWSVGARRAAWEDLDAWHAATAAPRAPALQAAWLAARAWWLPDDAPSPAADDLVGAFRCRHAPATCDPWVVADAGDPDEVAALLAAPAARTTDPGEALAWTALTLSASLHADAPWGAALSARVALAALPLAQFPAATRTAIAQLSGRAGASAAPPAIGAAITAALGTGELPAPTRLVAAAARILDDQPDARVVAALGPLADTRDGRALLAIARSREPAAPPSAALDPTTALADHVAAQVPGGPPAAALVELARGYARDPAIADRLALDAIARAPDAAVAHAALATLYDALGDPARSRAAWEAAVAASRDPAWVTALAIAIARAGDPDAALVIATEAAAADGDPAAVWLAVGRALHAARTDQHALEAARSAIDLGAGATRAAALELAAAASTALGRRDQAAALVARRAATTPARAAAHPDDPTDPAAARAAGTPDRLWTASRWNRRDVALRAALLDALPAGDPRRAAVTAELAALATDPVHGRDAVRALIERARRDGP